MRRLILTAAAVTALALGSVAPVAAHHDTNEVVGQCPQNRELTGETFIASSGPGGLIRLRSVDHNEDGHACAVRAILVGHEPPPIIDNSRPFRRIIIHE